jgi:chorismate mutase / prephenate dehydratase
MSDKNASEAERLAAQRAKIDAVDETIHNLLMQRAGVIDELIRIKGAAKTKGAAFRPGREAAMMESLSGRHKGSIPFVMIGHIWREIISTFTHLQASYDVHVALEGAEPHAIHDMARYQFGFSLAMHNHATIANALAATKSMQNAIAVVATQAPGPWWKALGADNGLMVMARLPIHNLPFAAPDCLCIAPPLSDPSPFDVRVYAVTAKDAPSLSRWPQEIIMASADEADGKVHALIALKAGQKAPTDLLDIIAVGGYFAPVIA